VHYAQVVVGVLQGLGGVVGDWVGIARLKLGLVV